MLGVAQGEHTRVSLAGFTFTHCFEMQVHELQSLGFGPKEGSLQALFQHGGDVARALTELQRQRLEPFHQRLWDRDPEPTPCWDGLDRQVLGVGKALVSNFKEQEKIWGRGEDPRGSDHHCVCLLLNHIAELGQTPSGRLHTPQLGPSRAGAGAAAGDTQEL